MSDKHVEKWFKEMSELNEKMNCDHLTFWCKNKQGDKIFLMILLMQWVFLKGKGW